MSTQQDLADGDARTNTTYWAALKYWSAPNWAALLPIGLIILLAAILRIYNLGTESFSYDEGIMINATGTGIDQAIADIVRGRPPVLVVLGFLWVSLFGVSEVASRSLPALFGILSIPLVYLIGNDLFCKRDLSRRKDLFSSSLSSKTDGQHVGLIGALLLSVSLFHIFHSQDYRYYALLGLMSLLFFFFYIHALQTGQTKYFIGFVISGILVYYTHYQGVFVLVAQGIHFLLQWARYPMRTRIGWFASQWGILLGLSVSLLKILSDFRIGASTGNFQGSLGAMGTLGPLSDPEWWLPLHTLLVGYMFISVENLLNWSVLAASIGFLVVATLLYKVWAEEPFLPRRPSFVQGLTNLAPDRATSNAVLLLFCWMLCPILIPFALSKLIGPMYLPRYTIGALPAFCLLTAFLFTSIRRVVPEIATVGAALILVLPGLQTYYAMPIKERWPEAAAFIETQEKPTDRLVFVSFNNEPAGRIQKVFERYYDGEISGEEATCVIDAGTLKPDEALAALRNCQQNHERLWLVTRTANQQARAMPNQLFLDPPNSHWRLLDEHEHVRVAVRLLVRK